MSSRVCKECGILYNTEYPLCPKCTERYNEVYNRSNLDSKYNKKRNIPSQKTGFLTLSLCLSILMVGYTFISFFQQITSSNEPSEYFASGIMIILFWPSLGSMFVGFILHFVGYFTKIRGLVLAAGILYIVSGVLSIILIVHMTVVSVFTIIAYSKMRQT